MFEWSLLDFAIRVYRPTPGCPFAGLTCATSVEIRWTAMQHMGFAAAGDRGDTVDMWQLTTSCTGHFLLEAAFTNSA